MILAIIYRIIIDINVYSICYSLLKGAVICLLFSMTLAITYGKDTCRCYKDFDFQTFSPKNSIDCKDVAGNVFGFESSRYSEVFKVYFNKKGIIDSMSYSFFSFIKYKKNSYKVLVLGKRMESEINLKLENGKLLSFFSFEEPNRRIHMSFSDHMSEITYKSYAHNRLVCYRVIKKTIDSTSYGHHRVNERVGEFEDLNIGEFDLVKKSDVNKLINISSFANNFLLKVTDVRFTYILNHKYLYYYTILNLFDCVRYVGIKLINQPDYSVLITNHFGEGGSYDESDFTHNLNDQNEVDADAFIKMLHMIIK